MDCADRIRVFRKSKGLSQEEFSAKVETSRGNITDIERRKVKPQLPVLQKISEAFDINLNWLISGQGAMHLSDENLSATTAVGTFITPKGKTETVSIGDGMLSVPIIAQRVSAGPGQPWMDDDMSEERIPVLERLIRRYPPEKLFATEVRGDSMKEAQLEDADIAIFVMGEIEGDDIYVLSVDGEIYVKHVEFDPFDRKLTIRSKNALYQPKVVDPERVTLLGKVVAWFHVTR